jgi:hypothetical protein
MPEEDETIHPDCNSAYCGLSICQSVTSKRDGGFTGSVVCKCGVVGSARLSSSSGPSSFHGVPFRYLPLTATFSGKLSLLDLADERS